jgi:hypothetical protein
MNIFTSHVKVWTIIIYSSLLRTVELYKQKDGRLVAFKKLPLDNMTDEEEKV